METKIKKIAYVASECQPFFASGGLGDVVGSLPKRIVKQSKGEYEISVILPLYSLKMNPKYFNKLIYVGQTTVKLSWRNQYCGIYKYVEGGVKYYFIDNEYYFKRANYYGYFDDAERFAYFSKAAIEVMIYLNEIPDILHAHDWQTGMVSVYLRTLYYNDQRFANLKSVFTIHNIEYQGKYSFDDDIIEDVFGVSVNDAHLFEYKGHINIMKGAMEASNIVSTVSPTYAEEILTPEYAHGLEHEVVRVKEEGKLIGILNGIDKNFYNPAKDDSLFVKYNKDEIENKKINKVELQKMLALPTDENIPMFGMVTRLVHHKGVEYIKQIFNELMQENIQLVILGTGDSYYEGYFKDMEAKYPHKVRAIISYNQDLSRKIYGSCDFFLMPSKSEPCGLSQMIASRYGTIPVVRETGGLKDSIHNFEGKKGNGYTFSGENAGDLLNALKHAISDYQNKELHLDHINKVIKTDFGWSASAKSYINMYKKFD